MIAFDNSSDFRFIIPGTDTLAFKCSTDSGRYLLVVSSFNVTAISYAGVNMSRLYTFTDPISDGNGNNMYVYGLPDPASGTNNLVVTATGNGNIGIVSYAGVYGISQPEALDYNFSNNGLNNTQVVALSSSITALSSGAWAVMFSRGNGNNQNFISGAGTLRSTGFFFFGDGTEGVIDSNGPITTQTLTSRWNSGTGFISNVIFSLKAQQDFVPKMIII